MDDPVELGSCDDIAGGLEVSCSVAVEEKSVEEGCSLDDDWETVEPSVDC